MTAALLSRDAAAPMLPFDFQDAPAVPAAEDTRAADRRLCRAYLGSWANAYKAGTPAGTVTFEDFQAAAARLGSAA